MEWPECVYQFIQRVVQSIDLHTSFMSRDNGEVDLTKQSQLQSSSHSTLAAYHLFFQGLQGNFIDLLQVKILKFKHVRISLLRALGHDLVSISCNFLHFSGRLVLASQHQLSQRDCYLQRIEKLNMDNSGFYFIRG